MRLVVVALLLSLVAPVLADEPPPAWLRTPEAEHRARLNRKIGIGFLAGAAAFTAVGALFAGLAKNANDAATANNVYDPTAVDRRNSFQSLEAASFALGATGLVSGLIFFFDR
jgi:hypothetical protein